MPLCHPIFPTPKDPPKPQKPYQIRFQSQILMMAFWLQRIVQARLCGRAMPFGEGFSKAWVQVKSVDSLDIPRLRSL